MYHTPPTTEERIWAVLAHLSSLAFGIGILLPVIGWSEQRRKSKYASFQCLQALGYQSLGYTVWLLSLLLWIVVVAVVLLVMFSAQAGSEMDPDLFGGLWAGFLILTLLGMFAVYCILPLIAAIACGLGKDFRYPIMGKRLAKYLGYQQADESDELIEDHEDRWVASMGHFGVLILLWGMLAPATAWILQGKRSTFLKFQSIQTVLFHTIVTILYFGGFIIYFVGFFAFIATTGLAGVPGDGLPVGMITFGIFIVCSLVAVAVFMLVPLFHILGQWAGYRVLKGDDYRYPLIGRRVERWLTDRMVQSPDSAAAVLEEKPS